MKGKLFMPMERELGARRDGFVCGESETHYEVSFNLHPNKTSLNLQIGTGITGDLLEMVIRPMSLKLNVCASL